MSKEYIEREALIEELKRRDFLPVIVKQAIEAVPAADVAPVVHGRWIDGTCSECHFDAMYYSNSDTQAYTRCCPHCGAMMDGKERR